jgi:hypothetical protein
MSNFILTFFRRKLNFMRKILTISWLWGPLATVAFTVAYHAAMTWLGLPANAVWLTVFVVWGTFASGLRGGLAAAAWGALYAFYTLSFDRAVQVAAGLPLIALAVGWQTQQLRRYYQAADRLLNGNAVKLQEGLQALRDAKARMSDARKEVAAAEDKLGNVLAGVVGYRGLRGTIEEVNEWYSHPENIARVKRMEEAEEADKEGGG